jgi:hypothetical protein
MNKAHALLAVVVLALAASTATAGLITWGAAQNISAESDLLNTGTPLYAYAFGTAGATTLVAEGSL